MRKASPMAWAPVVQAVATAEFGPLAPRRTETWPAARVVIEARMKNGETRLGPRSRAQADVLGPPPAPVSRPCATPGGGRPFACRAPGRPRGCYRLGRGPPRGGRRIDLRLQRRVRRRGGPLLHPLVMHLAEQQRVWIVDVEDVDQDAEQRENRRHRPLALQLIAHQRADDPVALLREAAEIGLLQPLDDRFRGPAQLAADLGLIVTGSSDHHGTGKIGHELGRYTTAPEQYERLLDLAGRGSTGAGGSEQAGETSGGAA